MKPLPEEPRPGQDKPPSKLSRTDQAKQVVEEYAADLREVIKKLREKLNWDRPACRYGPEPAVFL